MIRVGLLGANGRMGALVAGLLQSDFAAKASLAAAPKRGEPLDALVSGEAGNAIDVVIDFSSPAAMLLLVEAALKHPGALPAFVVGSTGWKLEERHKLEELAQKTPVLAASNFSNGVLALAHILKQAAPLLEKLGYTPVIVETHHGHKKDAPSGTALSLQRAIAPSGPGNVQTHSVRAGEVIGDHEVTFHGIGDRLTLGHFAQDRSIFARGAIEAALWLARRRDQPSSGVIGIEQYFKDINVI